MTTIRQLIQTSPTKANELFGKLVDTSEKASKTRERLFTELKEELEFLAGREEQHLFPILRKHKDLKDLVREAINDNKATRKLLADLDGTPKDTEEFAGRVAELRRIFQQHVRDEKKELLPAILKALSDEEAEAVVERIEAGKAEIEEAKRAEAEERQAEARREREKAEAERARTEAAQRAEAQERRAVARQQREEAERLQHAAEVVVNTAWAAPRAAEQARQTAQELAEVAVDTASDLAQRTTDQVAQVLDATRQRTLDLTERAASTLQTVNDTSTAVARGVQDLSSECIDMIQERLRKNLNGVNALLHCRTLPELLLAQSTLVRDNLELTLTNTRRIAELSARVSDNVARRPQAQDKSSVGRAA